MPLYLYFGWGGACVKGAKHRKAAGALDPASPSAVLLTGGMRAIPDSQKRWCFQYFGFLTVEILRWKGLLNLFWRFVSVFAGCRGKNTDARRCWNAERGDYFSISALWRMKYWNKGCECMNGVAAEEERLFSGSLCLFKDEQTIHADAKHRECWKSKNPMPNEDIKGAFVGDKA